jgi:hypothetical protein
MYTGKVIDELIATVQRFECDRHAEPLRMAAARPDALPAFMLEMQSLLQQAQVGAA